MTGSRLFAGVCAFPITPADANGRVDTALLGRLLEPLCQAGVDSIGLLGSTGTYAYFTRGERARAVAAAAECVANRVPLVVGVGALRTDHAQDLARDARDAGADALLMAPVSYTPLTQDEAFEHYRAVAGVTDLPLCVYNNPSTTHFHFTVELLERLARIDTIRAVKIPLPANGDFAGELSLLRERTGLSVGYSGDWGTADALLAGADAFYSVLAGILPGPILRMAHAASSGLEAEARHCDGRLEPLWETFKAYGSLRVVYALLSVLKLGEALPPLPIRPLDGAARDAVARAVEPVLAEV